MTKKSLMEQFKNNGMIKLFFCAALVLFFIIPFSVSALVISQVYFTDIDIEKNSYVPGENIEGNFTVWNYEQAIVPDLTYRFKLLGKDEQNNFTVIFDDQPSCDYFFLSPDQKSNKPFNYQLPAILRSGEYKLSVQLFNSKGIPMAWEEKRFNVSSGSSEYLSLADPWIVKDQEMISPAGEAIFDPDQTPQIVFDIHNPSSSSIKARAKITIYKNDVNEDPIKVIEQDLADITAGSSQSETLNLIPLPEAGFYLALAAMYDEKNDPISNLLYFRWSISGERAEIIEIQPDQLSYQPDEIAEVVVDIGAVSEEDEKGTLTVKIIDEEGKVAGEAEKEIDLKTERIKMEIPITKEVVNPRFETVITNKEGGELAQYEVNIKAEETPETDRGKVLIITITAIMFLVLSVPYLRKRKRATGKYFLFFLFFLGILFFAGSEKTLAFDQVSAGPPCCDGDTAISFSNPLPDSLYEAGGYIPSKGLVLIPSSPFSPLVDNTFEFYLGDESDIVLKDYDTGINIIKVIDEENSNVVKLGKAEKGPSKYNITLKIPVDTPFIGTARFYVQYKGKRPAPKTWHWIIGYQEIEIQKAGQGGLSVSASADGTELYPGEEVDLTIKIANKAPCIRFPIDVVEILDVSGSMNGQKLIDAKDAAKIFLDELSTEHDQVGLVSYSNDGILNSALTNDFDSIKTAVDSLTAWGWTCVSCGTALANNEIIDNSRSNAVRYEVLMTDGMANYCIDTESATEITGDSCILLTPRQEIKNYAQDAADENITVYTVGFGVGADGDLLKEVAEITGGNYVFAPTGEELKKIFKAIAGDLLGWSHGTKITIDIPEEYFTLEEYDTDKCTYDGDILLCEEGSLECGDKTTIDSLTLKIKVRDDITEEANIEIKAVVSNDAGKSRESEAIPILVLSNHRPDRPDPTSENWTYCNFSGSPQVNLGVSIILNWTYFDADDVPLGTDPQSAYEIWIDNNAAFSGPKFNHIAEGVSSPAHVLDLARDDDGDWIDNLKWGSTYYWKVRVRDQKGRWSFWSSTRTLVMPSHSYPNPKFDHTPEVPNAKEPTNFIDGSICLRSAGPGSEYNCRDDGDNRYLWDFGDGEVCDSNENSACRGSVTHLYPEHKEFSAKLSITDDLGTCSYPTAITVRVPLPEWEEVSPF